MIEDQFEKDVNQKSKSVTFLWVAALVLFLACAAVVAGLWMSYNKDSADRQLALSNNIESGDVLGTSTEDLDYLVQLAENLKTDGVVLYGYDGNQGTKKQLSIFGQAITSLDYVECNSGSYHANADECVAKGIDQYPTWVRGEEKMIGYKTLSDLENILANK